MNAYNTLGPQHSCRKQWIDTREDSKHPPRSSMRYWMTLRTKTPSSKRRRYHSKFYTVSLQVTKRLEQLFPVFFAAETRFGARLRVETREGGRKGVRDGGEKSRLIEMLLALQINRFPTAPPWTVPAAFTAIMEWWACGGGGCTPLTTLYFTLCIKYVNRAMTEAFTTLLVIPLWL